MDVGVIGVGVMGKNHLRIYSEMRGVGEVYAYDVDKNSLMKACNATNATPCDSLKSLLRKVDAVSICVPTKYHFETAKKVFESNINFLLEKPVTMTLKEGLELVKMAERLSHVVVGVGHIERFNPIVSEIKSLIDQPKLIEIKRHNPASSRITDSDITSDLMIHDIDIIWNYLFEKKQEKQLHSVGNQDVRKVVAEFDDCIVSLSASRISCKKIRNIVVECDKFTIEGDFMTQEVYLYKKPDKYQQDTTKYTQENIIEKVLINKVEPLKEELKVFLDSVRNSKAFPVTLEQGVSNIYLAKKIEGGSSFANEVIPSQRLITKCFD
ncbi:MAG: gfo/Idh/MocA family oxidoreductase [Candidatus Methanosuratincola subterraneus]|uniref:Gfo/Idh/MocA family oxidoreductase n=1 Tax=Methanosuratincola subterraneus TaxID=2593994 RepID=A0A444L791_METS7|nr:MAG: gfo/Idh/MocA family oxidoreductase [Candidatus Methanosuratincola subterraneus]